MKLNNKFKIKVLKYQIGLKEINKKVNIFPSGKFKKKHHEKN